MAIDYGYRLISSNQLNRNGRNLIASEPVCADIYLVHDGRLFETKHQLMLRGRRKSKRFAVWMKGPCVVAFGLEAPVLGAHVRKLPSSIFWLLG